MSNFFNSSDWILAREFLFSGHPPIIVQLLILNTIVLIIWMFRRARGAQAMRASSANTIQIMLILANCAVILNGDYGFIDFQISSSGN